jgi:5'-3' exonuclease
MIANGEADSLCAKLYKEGFITACLSDDMDMLPLGCGKTIKFVEGKIIEFNLMKILEGLDLEHDEFIDMCILFGCDYIRTHNKLNYNESYELIKKYRSIKNILDNANHEILNYENEKCNNLISEHQHIHYLFVNACDTEHIDINNKISITKKIGVIDVIGFLTIRCPKILKYKGNKIKYSIDYINNHIINNLMNI